MLIAAAREIARQWVYDNAASRHDFAGAFFAGSTGESAADAALPATSDVDIVVVVDSDIAPPKLGKVTVSGIVLEVTFAALADFADAATVADTYYLANSFRRDQLIADPTGRLRAVQMVVGAGFGQPKQIMRRCDHAIGRIRSGLATLDPSAPWHDLIMGWMFSTSIATHVVLIAALRNPTVRLRYVAAREVLVERGRVDLYDELLEQLGARDVSAETVARWLDALEPVFDDAVRLGTTPFFYSSDISDDARHIAFDGSRRLIADGLHREAVFWIVATYTRCMAILTADAPRFAEGHDATFRQATRELLGVRSRDDLVQRAVRTVGFLPRLRSFAAEVSRSA